MASSWQVNQNKRGRDEYWNGGLAFPEAKRSNSRPLAHDSDMIALLDMIDDLDRNDNNPEQTKVAGIINSLEDEIGLKLTQIDHNIEDTDEKGSADRMGSIQQGQLTANGSTSEPTLVTPDIGNFAYYDDVGAELGFLVDIITPHELGIIMNHIHGDSMPDIMYSDAVDCYAETSDIFYGSLWEDDI